MVLRRRCLISNSVYGLNVATGEIIWPESSNETLFAWLGTCIPSEGGQELFGAVAYEVTANLVSDSFLVVVDSHNHGRTERVEIALEQVVISEPQGDQNGLYLTLEDGTLIALPSSAVIDGE